KATIIDLPPIAKPVRRRRPLLKTALRPIDKARTFTWKEKMRLLIVEDDDILRDGLKVGLSLAGFTTDAVATCEGALAALEANRFDAVVLDLMLPDGSGLDVLKSLRTARDETPVLMLTARDAVVDRIA